MKLYYTPGVCSLSPHIILKETGLPHSLVKVDMRAKTIQGGGNFNGISPLGYVPVLELDDGSILAEGPAIVQYIADKAPEKGLAPASGTIDRYRMQSWLNFVSSELHKSFSPLFNPAMPEDGKKIFRARLTVRLAFVDDHLARGDYLMGSGFSCPDAYLFTVLRWTIPAKIDMSPFPSLAAFMRRVEARPAVQAAMRAERLLSG